MASYFLSMIHAPVSCTSHLRVIPLSDTMRSLTKSPTFISSTNTLALMVKKV
uniref:Uncharacterized protein n=1 Tax=Ciona intestinalis TaxID=7719 RepID=H2XN30_CIOIN